MRKLFFLFCILSSSIFAQKKDYKSYDRAVKYSTEGKMKKAIRFANKALLNNQDWSLPNLLLASIYSNNQQIDLAANHLLQVYNHNGIISTNGAIKLIKLYYSNGLYEDALFYADKITSKDTNSSILNNEISRYVENCKFANNALKNPIEFNPLNIKNDVNSEFAEFVNFISIDGKKLFFTRRIESDNSKPQEDLYFYNFENNKLTSLAFNTLSNEGAITMSPNGKMFVYTACDRINSIGGCDLFIRNFDSDNGWSREYNLGETVNSEFWDTQACFSPDGKYLYFISNRFGGFGNDDIWRSEITSLGFKQAENLGALINTKYNEMSPFLHSDNVTLYFASNGHIGMGDYDIFVSRRVNNIEDWGSPENIGYPINTYKSENSLIVSNDGKTSYYTSNESGFGLEDIFVFDLPKSKQAEEISKIEIDVITNKIGDEIVLNNVTFNSNSHLIKKSSYFELDKLILLLKKYPNFQIEIQGHTDDVGNDYDNLILSHKRAKSIYEYLQTRVNNVLTYVGYGESMPIAKNDSEEGRAINRRTSFIIQ